MIATLLWIHLLALVGLFVEILLVRVFDTIVGPNAAYTIVTVALLGGGIAGLAIAFRPSWPDRICSPTGRARLSLATALAILAIYPSLQALPFSVERISEEPFLQLVSFVALFLVLSLPFFLIGLGVASALTLVREQHWIYGADLLGAALGAIAVSPLLPHLGPVGALFASAGLLVLGAALTRPVPRRRAAAAAVFSLVLLGASLGGSFRELDVDSHAHKRSARETELRRRAEFRRWDSVSKIEVVDVTERDPVTGLIVPGSERKLVSYDGGSQSSHIYPFDGDFDALRAQLPGVVIEHFWQRGLLSAHYLLRDQGARTLIIGCAGGQEVKAALAYGAAHVDALDLVETVVELGTGRYAGYNGGIFLDPRVDFFQAEARAYLAARPEPYDLIQVFSYHNSARLAAGGGAVKAYYLETVEALSLFLENLSQRGLLQINQSFYPRVLVTLGEAMEVAGWSDPASHVVVYSRDGLEDHATILVSRQPWDAERLDDLDSLLLAEVPSEGRKYRRVIDPLDPVRSFLPAELWTRSDDSARALRARAPYRLDPVTDDRPFAYFLRKNLDQIEADSTRFVDRSIAELLHQPFTGGWLIPRDLAHLAITAGLGLLLALGSAWAPWRMARAGREPWPGRAPALTYFSCLGAGFLLIELTLVQLGLRAIGVPIQAYATTIGTLLISAGAGSMISVRFRTRPVGALLLLLAVGSMFALTYPRVWDIIQGESLAIRIGAVALMLAPLGFCLGLPFPLGLEALRGSPPGAIAWAWTANSIFTALGGVGSAICALYFGLQRTLWTGLVIYLAAALLFLLWQHRRERPDAPRSRLHVSTA